MEAALLKDNVYVVQMDGKDTDWIEAYYSDKGTPVKVSLADTVSEVFKIYKVEAK